MGNFFQNAQNHGFWNFDFWFLSRGKKAVINYCLYEWKHVIMKNERISLPPPTQYCALLVNLWNYDKAIHRLRKKWWITPLSANYSTDQKNFTGLMFNIKSEKKSWKMSFKALPVKTQRLKNNRDVYIYYTYIYIYIKFGCSNVAYYNCTWSWYLSHSKSTIFYCVILRKKKWVAKHATEQSCISEYTIIVKRCSAPNCQTKGKKVVWHPFYRIPRNKNRKRRCLTFLCRKTLPDV